MSNKEFEELIKIHNGTIHAACNRYCNATIDRDDLVQEVILELLKSLNNFKKTCTFNTWVYTIARNVCVTVLRKQKSKPTFEGLEEYAEVLIHEDYNEELVKQLQQAKRYNTVLDTIEEPYRTLFIMYLEGVTYEEMEKQTGITVNSLRAKICNIKKRLCLRYGGKITD